MGNISRDQPRIGFLTERLNGGTRCGRRRYAVFDTNREDYNSSNQSGNERMKKKRTLLGGRKEGSPAKVSFTGVGGWRRQKIRNSPERVRGLKKDNRKQSKKNNQANSFWGKGESLPMKTQR